jgi:ketosteroid isomerase-like protein
VSEENVEIVRRLSLAFNAYMRGELSIEAYGELFDPQVHLRWHDQQTYPDTPQQLPDLPALMAFAEQYREEWVDLVSEPLELIEAPDGRVLALIRQSGQGRQSGVPIVIHFFEVVAIRGGRVRQLEYFRHRADAIKAAGLRE